MPAMSPTMTEGGISSWKKKEGETFAAGDVLLEIETDKATIDVEAQENGVVGKILAPDGTKNIPVGKLIALLAEEGDDIVNLEVPKDEEPSQSPPTESSSSASQSQSTSTPSPASHDSPAASSSVPESLHHHGEIKSSRTLFPSVLRILQDNGITDADQIKGTGIRGMVTKGDVLTFLGEASGPLGTWKEALEKDEEKMKSEKSGVKKAAAPPPPLDGPALRRLIVSNMLEASQKAYRPIAGPVPDFDDIIADYYPTAPKVSAPPAPVVPSKNETKKASDPFQGLY
ncbi:hypothetical protein PHLGIDRAFT_111879 [Phlebiopsis gigantea 11061_1 CR5-6]|uniref:Lipoyl-binding domain-containing protein n=1 Tax=Phlebiopsis gigantea (strain 11061_1 CR5-6) TaxID=745531 RepID=A0A0C3NDL6_PHLG1|nr:hypothetical protein PHLGIDRAFT_111879 [Phlebiopsis gigantea 11061_1 CR5-6]